ncbi:hypothetical protein SKAU_G00003680 [Synaphobranchus kaupii]|uniref:Uncharacterized protein n=1 Tax=Synaphobranchus kaupii TaxID=118154 RepID=A0A9Q1JCA2_SYNKA|nr:hypothetical protein SKAU_G00003680 [Synaphobranchus kaupii]
MRTRGPVSTRRAPPCRAGGGGEREAQPRVPRVPAPRAAAPENQSVSEPTGAQTGANGGGWVRDVNKHRLSARLLPARGQEDGDGRREARGEDGMNSASDLHTLCSVALTASRHFSSEEDTPLLSGGPAGEDKQDNRSILPSAGCPAPGVRGQKELCVSSEQWRRLSAPSACHRTCNALWVRHLTPPVSFGPPPKTIPESFQYASDGEERRVRPQRLTYTDLTVLLMRIMQEHAPSVARVVFLTARTFAIVTLATSAYLCSLVHGLSEGLSRVVDITAVLPPFPRRWPAPAQPWKRAPCAGRGGGDGKRRASYCGDGGAAPAPAVPGKFSVLEVFNR